MDRPHDPELLRRIRTTSSCTELADCLEQYIGKPPSEARCIEAYYALQERPADDDVRRYGGSLGAVFNKEWIFAVQNIIDSLKNGNLSCA